MESGHPSQSTPLQDNNRRFQWLPLVNQAQPDDDSEGGLNLGQVLDALRRRLLIIAGVTTVVTSLAVLKALTSTPTYQSRFEILIKPVTVEAQVISSVPQTLSNKEQQQPEKGLDETTLRLLKSPKMLVPVAKQLQAKYPDINYDNLAIGLVVTSLPGSEILEITYQDANPEKIKAVLQLVSETYLDYSLEERLADVRQGIDFVDAQLPQLQERVALLQDKLQGFRQQNNLIDPESQGKKLAEQSSSVGQQRLDNQVKLNEVRALYEDLTRQLSAGGATASVLSENSRYQKLLGQILDLESQIATESSLYHEGSADIRVLRDQQRNLLPLLQQEAQRVQAEVASKIRELEARNLILAQTDTQLNQQIKQLSSISRQYTDIQRELQIATDNLNQFLAKREALRIDAGQRKVPWQLLTPPTAPFPSAASVKRTGVLGGILGLLLGVGIALLLDKLSNALHTPEQAKDISRLPILGVVPFNPDLENLEETQFLPNMSGFMEQIRQKLKLDKNASQLSTYAASPFLEVFRSLQINIRLLNPDAQVRSLVISSPTAGDGKSTISVHLAQAAAAMGQRVLLVDTDLRLPQLHHRLALMNVYGLSNVVSSENLDFEQVVQQLPSESNLYVLTAGQTPPDAIRLLSSQKMQNLMERFKEVYDLVIYDTPPVVGLADAKLIAARTDGMVMVVQLNKTKTSALTQALDGLKLSSVAVLGIVANQSRDYPANLYDSYHKYYKPSPKVISQSLTSEPEIVDVE